MHYLRQRNREWDMLDLVGLDSDSPCLDGLFMNDTWYTRYSDSYLYTAFEGTWDDFLATQSRHRRSKLAREERYLRRDYPDREITYQIHQSFEDGQHVFDALMRFIYLRWADEGETVEHYMDRAVARFVRATTQMASRMGGLRLYSMWVGDELVSVELLLVEQGTGVAHDIAGAFDRRWSEYGVGTLLFNYVIRDAIANGVRRLEMGEGVTDQKVRYSTGQHADLYIRTAARRDVQLWLQSVEAGRGAWAVIKKALPQNARETLRQALGFGEPELAQ
jgi:CelD/BcsL family acetyltransferase involved in cellulose biosynthesis